MRISYSLLNRIRQIVVALGCIVVTHGVSYAQDRPQRGRVVYEGTYSGKQVEGFVLFNQGPELIGAITLTVDFDGSAVKATYKTTGKLAGGSATGLVDGDVCKLFGNGNLTIEGDCTGSGFKGKLFQQPKPELRRQVTFELSRRSENVVNPGVASPAKETTQPSANSVIAEAPPRQADLSGSERPKLSELRDEDFIQNATQPQEDPNNTRIAIARNLLIDISGKYPVGYKPAWRFISYKSGISVTVEDWVNPQSQASQAQIPFHLGDYSGKAVVRINGGGGIECLADLIMKQEPTVLTEKVQVFELGNFRRILNDRSTGELCVSNRARGGYAGKLALAANRNGDIAMTLMLESYTLTRTTRKETFPPQVHFRYTANNISLENEMTPQKVNAQILAEQEAKQRQKDYLEKMTTQAEALQKEIAQKFPQSEVRSCFESSSGAYLRPETVEQYYVNSGNYAGSTTTLNVRSVIEIKNVCNYPITFVGIEQRRDAEQGYFLAIVTKTMPENYQFKSDQGMLGTLFTAFVGGGSEFQFAVQDKYYPKFASPRAPQWLKVIRN